MNIKDTFLRLTSKTYPNGSESELFDLLPNDLESDDYGNKYFIVGNNPTCMFTSHLDTATSTKTDVIHTFEGDLIKTDGKSILGADDKAGVTIMLHMIKNKIPGIYYFFLGEEVGCLGSRYLSELFIKDDSLKFPVNKVISFDRRGYDSVITFQSSQRCCSETFATALANELNKFEGFSYKPDDTGIYTDSAKFVPIYPECTNISVGYKNEHTHREEQNIQHLINLSEAVLKVDWENLPVERDPKSTEYKSYSGYGYGGGYSRYGCWGDDDWNDEYFYYPRKNDTKKPDPVVEPEYFYDTEFGFISKVLFDKNKNILTEIDFSHERILYEDLLVESLLNNLEVEYDTYTYDGLKLEVKHKAGHNTECSREELVEFIPELDFWKKETETYSHFS